MKLYEHSLFLSALQQFKQSYDLRFKKIGFVMQQSESSGWTLSGRHQLKKIQCNGIPPVGSQSWKPWSNLWEWHLEGPLHHALCHQFCYDALLSLTCSENDAVYVQEYIQSGRLGDEFWHAETAEEWWSMLVTKYHIYNGFDFLTQSEHYPTISANQEEVSLTW